MSTQSGLGVAHAVIRYFTPGSTTDPTTHVTDDLYHHPGDDDLTFEQSLQRCGDDLGRTNENLLALEASGASAELALVSREKWQSLSADLRALMSGTERNSCKSKDIDAVKHLLKQTGNERQRAWGKLYP